MKKISLSVCVITKNEEKFIEKCLLSVKDIAGEIILADTGSTDNTIDIAKRCGAKVYTTTWTNDYSHARNFAIDKASCDWILFLDADEYLEAGDNILKVLEKHKHAASTGGFLLERLDVFRDKKTGRIDHYPVGLVRLFRNNPAFRFRGTVHEQVNAAITDAGFTIEVVNNSRIIHQVFASTDDFLTEKQTRYLHLIEKELEADAANWYMQYQKAKTLWFLERKEEAIDLFSTIKDNTACPVVIHCSAYCNLALLFNEKDAFEQAESLAAASIALNSSQSLGYLVQGNIFYKANNFKKAIKCYKKVNTKISLLKYDQIIPGDLYVYPEEQFYRVAICYLAMHKLYAALYLLKKALRKNPGHTASLFVLGVIKHRQGNNKAALEYVNKCVTLNPGWKEPQALLKQLNGHTV